MNDDKHKKKVKQFFRFLKEYNAYSRYITLYKKWNHQKDFSTIAESVPVLNWVSSIRLFTSWRLTKEGDMYWWAISILWKIYIGEIVNPTVLRDYLHYFNDNFCHINNPNISENTLLELAIEIEKTYLILNTTNDT